MLKNQTLETQNEKEDGFYIQDVTQCAISDVFASHQTTFPAACSLRKDSNIGIWFCF